MTTLPLQTYDEPASGAVVAAVIVFVLLYVGLLILMIVAAVKILTKAATPAGGRWSRSCRSSTW